MRRRIAILVAVVAVTAACATVGGMLIGGGSGSSPGMPAWVLRWAPRPPPWSTSSGASRRAQRASRARSPSATTGARVSAISA